MSETVIRRRPTTGTDRYGNQTPVSWVDTPITVIALAPSGREGEQFEPGRSAVIAGLTLYAAKGTDLHPKDRVVARGTTWEIDGDVGVWDGPYGDLGGVVAVLKRVDG